MISTQHVAARFPPEPVSARAARRFLRDFLKRCGRIDLADDAELALSEVVTNAVLHAHTPIDVALSLDRDGALRAEVFDRNPSLPAQRHYAEQATTGRGMQLIAALTAECGVEAGDPDGKVVWFIVRGDSSRSPGLGTDDVSPGWDAPAVVDAPATTGASVMLLGLPPTLWLAAREHHDALLRELGLFAQEHHGNAPSPERFVQADLARGAVSTRVVAELERLAASVQAHRALPSGHPSPLPDTPSELDLEVRVPEDAAAAFGALQDVLDAAERLAVAGQLLARPGLPEVVAVRDWVCEQVIAQAAGVSPSRWAGTGQERFTVDVHDRSGPAVPDWDAAVVVGSQRGAVAADDANRIIAVSRPLADALGWDVDELVGRRVVALIPPELREAHVAGFTRHLTTGEAHVLGVPLRLPVLRADGTRLECDFLIEQAPATTGRAVYIAWIDPIA
ncbi:MAG TPA: ATP-binding protein [Nannocystis sp.]